MADSSRTIMTDAGFALETRVRADETKMQFTRAAISTDDHFSDTDDALAKLTELYNIQQDGKVTAVQVINTTTVYVQVDVNQAESKADYQMRSAALYAKDDDGTEVLYGVTALQDPVFVHKDADGSYLGFGINTTVGRASNVVVVVDPANMVTQQVFEGTMKNYYTKTEVDAKFVTDDDFASKLPKNIATTDAANTFAKSQTFAGGATDGAGNAIATTKDVSDGDAETLKSAKDYADTKISGKADDSKVVHTADMRKPANQVASIGEVNAKQDKIGYTPADDSKVVHTSDTSNWQKQKITNDDGSIIKRLTASNNDDLNKYLGNLVGGYTTFYVQNGVTNNPSTQSARGFILKESSVNGGANYGMGYLVDNTGSTWSILIAGSTTPTYTLLANDSKVAHLSGANNFDTVPTVNNNPLLLASSLPSDLARTSQRTNFTDGLQKGGKDVATVDDGSAKQDKLTITPADDSKVVHDNGDGTVTVDGRKFVPADTDHTIPVSEAGVAGPANFAAGTLKVDGLEVMGAKVFSDTDDYKTFAAAHPSAITIVTHNTSTS
ncbi:hypothetical protein I2491_00460 [Levilactobacillus brevis]|nr:hypothetical protein [Levilactobacillus brevis]